jgi:hypothetical protein
MVVVPIFINRRAGMLKNKFVRILFAFLIIYIAWSAYINATNLGSRIDSEALVPCLFYLPPLGFLVLGLVIIKIIESVVVVRLIKKIAHRKKKS